MCELKPGVKVVVIDDNHEVKKGVIRNCYESLETAIVELADGSVAKISYDCIGIDTEEQNDEPVEIDVITITNERFKEIGETQLAKWFTKLTDLETTLGLSLGLLLTAYHADLHSVLFTESVEND